MANQKTSDLTAAGALTGAELLQVVQTATSKRSTLAAVLAYIKTGLVKADVGLGNVTNDAQLKAADLDTDPTLAANSATKIPAQSAVKSYVDGVLSAADAMKFKGVINASGNPNYPAGDAGDLYRISFAGKIGGGAGINVEIGDTILCLVDGSLAGTQAAVGANWNISQANLDGAVIGAASAVDSNIAVFDGATGKIIKDGAVTVAGLVAATTTSAASKATPVDADAIPLTDSAASFVLKKLTWANLKATLKTYFDTLYNPLILKYTSPAQVITAAGSLTLAHGLASTPNFFSLLLVNTVAEHNFSIGNRFDPSFVIASSNANQGVVVVADATNLNIRFGAGAGAGNPVFPVLNKTTGASAAATNASWQVIFIAAVL